MGIYETGTFLFSEKTFMETGDIYNGTIEEEVKFDKSKSRARFLLYRTRTEKFKTRKIEKRETSGLSNLTFGKNIIGGQRSGHGGHRDSSHQTGKETFESSLDFRNHNYLRSDRG